MSCAYIIPSLEPDEKILRLVEEMKALNMGPIVVVDDGSPKAYAPIFDQLAHMGCRILRHPENRGKGAAIKTAIGSLDAQSLMGYVTADGDGQHRPEDILRVAKALEAGRDALILGIRSLRLAHVPFKSRYGNAFSSLFFKLRTGVSCGDTQTGLRGIPASLRDMALETPGNRYDYEMNFLVAAVERGVSLDMLPIDTVYEDKNRGSHFRAFRDAMLIYRQPLCYAASSLAGAAVDLSLFMLFSGMGLSGGYMKVLAATAGARIGSGAVNFLLNKRWSFRSRGRTGPQAAKYASLFVCQMAVSAALVSLLSGAGMASLAAKILVDGALFLLSYTIQKRLIFTK